MKIEKAKLGWFVSQHPYREVYLWEDLTWHSYCSHPHHGEGYFKTRKQAELVLIKALLSQQETELCVE